MKEKKIIIITGTSRGIGKALRKFLSGTGEYIVYGSSRSKISGDPNHLQLDVTDPESCRRAVQKVLAEQGRLDILINNAGSHLTGASEETSLEEIHSQMDLNFWGVVNMIKAVTPVMLDQREGRIINMSSLGGLLSLPYTSAYNASKFALEGYTESLRLELLPFGIWVSNLEPAYINSGTTDQSILPPKHDHVLFSEYRKSMHDKMLADSTKGIPLDLISKKIYQVVNTSRPAFRYRIGNMAKLLTRLNTIMPEGLFQRSVLRSFKLPVNVSY